MTTPLTEIEWTTQVNAELDEERQRERELAQEGWGEHASRAWARSEAKAERELREYLHACENWRGDSDGTVGCD